LSSAIRKTPSRHSLAIAPAAVSCAQLIGRRWLAVAALAPALTVSGCLGSAAQASAYVYWTANGRTFGRANLDGSGADQRFITAPGHPRGVAVDSSP
jgi:hypothetical protein